MKKTFLIALTFVTINACSSLPPTRVIASESGAINIPDDLPKGGRMSLHGMVVFGADPYFIEHIPMLNQPHDFQIVAEVLLTDPNGKPLTADFSHGSFTMKPLKNFALNDYLKSRFTGFDGEIHKGSFEEGGPIFSGLKKVHAEVKQFLFVRPLLPFQEFSKDSFHLSDGKNEFQTNAISPSRNFQAIKNTSTGESLWCVKGPDFGPPCD